MLKQCIILYMYYMILNKNLEFTESSNIKNRLNVFICKSYDITITLFPVQKSILFSNDFYGKYDIVFYLEKELSNIKKYTTKAQNIVVNC